MATGDGWPVYIVNEVRDWLDGLDDAAHNRVVHAIDALADGGPGLGRPLVGTIHGSSVSHLKELRPGTVRILFAFDPWRSSILLVAGDKRGRWREWYRESIPLAESAISATSKSARRRRSSSSDEQLRGLERHPHRTRRTGRR